MIVPVKFQVITSGVDPTQQHDRPVFIECTDQRGDISTWRWAVRQGMNCLNDELEWEYEPNPSSRTNTFLLRTRYSYDQAVEVIMKYFRANPPETNAPSQP